MNSVELPLAAWGLGLRDDERLVIRARLREGMILYLKLEESFVHSIVCRLSGDMGGGCYRANIDRRGVRGSGSTSG